METPGGHHPTPRQHRTRKRNANWEKSGRGRGGGGGVALPFNRRGLPPGGAVLFCFLNIVAVLALAFVLMFGNEQCSVEPNDLLKTGGERGGQRSGGEEGEGSNTSNTQLTDQH